MNITAVIYTEAGSRVAEIPLELTLSPAENGFSMVFKEKGGVSAISTGTATRYSLFSSGEPIHSGRLEAPIRVMGFDDLIEEFKLSILSTFKEG